MRFEDESNEEIWVQSMMISIDIPTVNEYINDHPCNEQVSNSYDDHVSSNLLDPFEIF